MIDPITLKAVSLALEAVTMRQDTSAANIANANNPSYVPKSVSFEDRLATAKSALTRTGQVDSAALVTPQLRRELDASGRVATSVHVDSELATLAQNALKHDALVKGLNNEFGMVSIALGQGK